MKNSPSTDLNVRVRSYLSPTLVLLALDWPDGAQHDDFLGFAILRSPGFVPGEKDGYLLNKIGFTPPVANSHPIPSNLAPIQKFMWWDSAVGPADRGKKFKYTVTPALGTGPKDLRLLAAAATTIEVVIPAVAQNGISTWFNRAVVSSQAFSREFPAGKMDIDKAMAWLANGMQDAIPGFLKTAANVEGAIYHLTDNEWVIPALQKFSGPMSLAYEMQPNKDTTNAAAVEALKGKKNIAMHSRSKTNIMHDKFLADTKTGRVLMGSANFTPEGLTSQANLLHVLDSPELAKLYAARARLLDSDPAVKVTAQGASWSQPVKVGKAQVRVFFSPEPGNSRLSIDTVVNAVKAAKQSVIFCMFSPTDQALLEALLASGDKKKIMFGLLNSITDPKTKQTSASGEPPANPSAATQIQVTVFNRSRKDKKVLPYDYFSAATAPAGFLPELSAVDFSSRSIIPPAKNVPPAKNAGKKKGGIPAVHIHHKFIVIDAETDNPVIYTGSANMSKNSVSHNDENLAEIKGNPELGQLYLAEFLRLYEHYRARALWHWAHQKGQVKGKAQIHETFTLKTKRDDWVRGAYKAGTPEYIIRTQLAGPPSNGSAKAAVA